jgi:hypothetical protein
MAPAAALILSRFFHYRLMHGAAVEQAAQLRRSPVGGFSRTHDITERPVIRDAVPRAERGPSLIFVARSDQLARAGIVMMATGT